MHADPFTAIHTGIAAMAIECGTFQTFSAALADILHTAVAAMLAEGGTVAAKDAGVTPFFRTVHTGVAALAHCRISQTIYAGVTFRTDLTA